MLWPEDPAAHEKLGLVMAERGRYELALESLEQARRQAAGPAAAGVAPSEIAVERHPSGPARTVTQTRRGASGRRLRHGLHTEWWPSGTLRRVVAYVDGVPRGGESTWDESGRRTG